MVCGRWKDVCDKYKLKAIGGMLLFLLLFVGCTKEGSDTEDNKVNGEEAREIINRKSEINNLILEKEQEREREGEKDEEEVEDKGGEVLSEEQEKLYYGEGNILDRIYEYLGANAENMGFMYYNINTSEEISFNKEKEFYAASLYKLNMNMVAYDMINNGEISAEDMLYLEYYPDEAGNELIDYNAYLEPTNIIQLLDNTIINSDNTAATMIYHYLGGWTAYRGRYMQLFNIGSNIWTDDTNVENEFKVLKYLYDNKDMGWYSHLIEVMEETAFHDRIDKYIEGDKVAHKVGNYNNVVNDEGIVFTDNPYIIIFLSDGVGYAADSIADISKAIYIYNTN